MFWGGLNGDGFADESDYDYGSYAEGPYNYTPHTPKPVTCNRCGCRGLQWKNTANGWRLMYGSGSMLFGKLHACDFEGDYMVKKRVNHFNTVMDVIDQDGFDYAFESYSNWDEINDEHFHTLRLNYLNAMQELSDYVASKTTDYED